jgi:hypothetical protein
MPDPLSNIERIEIERACERLVYTYVRALDQGDMGAAADCFAAAGSFARPMTPETVIHGREAIRAGLKARPASLLTKHVASNVLIEVDSRDSAHGISYLTMIATTPAAGAAPPHVSPGPLYFGEFRDRFVREDGVWRFLERRGSIQLKFDAAHG